MNRKAYIIAEAGCNHMGDIKIAKGLILSAKACGADAIKFQKRCPKELLSEEQYNAPHPNPMNAFGKTYGAHREYLEFTIDQHMQLKKWCEEVGITYSASVWDLSSAREIVGICPKYIKIPSACNMHFEMMQWICDNYKGEIQISLGMTTRREECDIIHFFEKNGRLKDLMIFSCTSGYPVQYEDICLLEISRLKEAYENKVKDIGFSGHHLGTAPDIAAYMLGANVIERHFTLDKRWKGTDQAASLEPYELKQLVDELSHVREALCYKNTEILPVEDIQRKKLKYRNNGQI